MVMPSRSSRGHPLEASQALSSLLALQRARFVAWRPSPIVSLACSSDGSLGAALREDGDVELFDLAARAPLRLLASSIGGTPTSLALLDGEAAWLEGGAGAGASASVPRLFVGALTGGISEIDLDTGSVASTTDSLGGAVWALAPERCASSRGDSSSDSDSAAPVPRLAAACDDGSVRLFSPRAGERGLDYAGSLAALARRALSLSWHPSAPVLAVAGTSGCVHFWKVGAAAASLGGRGASRELCRATVAGADAGKNAAERSEAKGKHQPERRAEKSRRTRIVPGDRAAIWTLLLLEDGTAVAGGADGSVTLLDSMRGTTLARFQEHHADVLALAASPCGRRIWAAGVDPRLVCFERAGPRDSWVLAATKRPHTHDVRALLLASGSALREPLLLSGGNDALPLAHVAARWDAEHPSALEACPQRPLVQAVERSGTGADPGQRAREGSKDAREGSKDARETLVLSARGGEVEVHSVRMRPAEAGVEGGPAAEALERPRLLLRLHNEGGQHVVAAALSHCARFLAFSDARRVAVFAVDGLAEEAGGSSSASEDESLARRDALEEPGASRAVSVRPISLPSELPPALRLAFVPGQARLAAACADGSLRLADLSRSPPVLAAVRDVHDLRYRAWVKRDRARSAARRVAPFLGPWSLSSCGRWLALAVRERVQICSLESLRVERALAGGLGGVGDGQGGGAAEVAPSPQALDLPPGAASEPQPLRAQQSASHVAALAFSSDGEQLLVVAARGGLAVYATATGEPTPWTAAHARAAGERVALLPGPVLGAEARPEGSGSMVIWSSGGICNLDLTQPVPTPTLGKKRRRDAVPLGRPGDNGRLLLSADPLLFFGFVGAERALAVEKSWNDAWNHLPAPMFRHRYGA